MLRAVFPLPWEIPQAAGHPTRMHRLAYEASLETSNFSNGRAGEVYSGSPLGLDAPHAGLDPRADLLVDALAPYRAERPFWSGGAADLKVIHAALQTHYDHDSEGSLEASIRPGVASFDWPLDRSRERLQDAFETLAESFGLQDLVEAERLHRLDEERRRSLRAWEARQWEDGALPYPAELYLKTLRRVATKTLLGAQDTAALPEAIPRQRAGYTGVNRRLCRVGLIGASELARDLASRLETAGLGVVFDEWTSACCFLRPSATLLDRYHDLALPYGLAARAESLAREGARRGVDAWVLVTAAFGASQMERIYFSERLDAPLLPLEVDGLAPLSESGRLRVEAFARRLERATP